MSVYHYEIEDVCTASHLSNWDIPGLGEDDPKRDLNARIKTVNELITSGFKEDFAMLIAIITEKQRKKYALDTFLPKIGFKMVFHGPKSNDTSKQRHQETGDLWTWCATPADYKENLLSYKEALAKLKDEIDPPKKPDPKRQAVADLKLHVLMKNNLVQPNTKVRNPVYQVLLVEPNVLANFITVKYGMDPRHYIDPTTKDWTKCSIQELKDYHTKWKNELF